MGIWDSLDNKYLLVDEKFRLSNEEGNTPVSEVKVGLNTRVSVKREDLNPSGSHKDRGLAFEISYHYSKGHTEFVISSSGNSAISAFNLIRNSGLSLTIFLSNNTDREKLSRLSTIAQISWEKISEKYPNIKIILTPKPLSESSDFAKRNSAFLLRGSKDPFATVGYTTLATEIAGHSSETEHIFIPTSSGTTLIGIFQGLQDLIEKGSLLSMPKLHVCQTTKINIFAREFDKNFLAESNSSVSSIIDRVGHRYKEVIDAVQQTNGGGWVINEDMITQTRAELEQNNIDYMSSEGILALSSVKKALSHGHSLNNIFVINTGHNDK